LPYKAVINGLIHQLGVQMDSDE